MAHADDSLGPSMVSELTGPSGTVTAIMMSSAPKKMSGLGNFTEIDGHFGHLVRFEWKVLNHEPYGSVTNIVGPWRRTRESARSAFFEESAKSDRIMNMLLGKVDE
jgi:hypothetical protein